MGGRGLDLSFKEEYQLALPFTAEDDWTYHLVHMETPPECFDMFATVVELWQVKKRGDSLPAWRNFDFDEFKDWWGWLTVIDLIPGGVFDGQFRLYGSNLVDLIGKELTGKSLRGGAMAPSIDQNGYKTHDFGFLEDVTRMPAIGIASGPVFWQNRDHVTITTLRLPLADDGKNVDRILSAVRRA